MPRTILYLTDNSLDPEIAAVCRKVLVREAGDIPIVSVSQKPIDLGRNVCVGEIGRSWLSLHRQIKAGLDVIPDGWVVVCEHDVLYTHEHLTYEPSDPARFWYNSAAWLVQWKSSRPELDGMYSYWPRRIALSQMIADRAPLYACIDEWIRITERSGRAAVLSQREWYEYGWFGTTVPNLDIRHSDNWTGAKRGKHRTYDLPPWGKFSDLWARES